MRNNFNFQSGGDAGIQICSYLQTQTSVTLSIASCGMGQLGKREDRAQLWGRLWRLLTEHKHAGREKSKQTWKWTSLASQFGLIPIIANISICLLYHVRSLGSVHGTSPWPRKTSDLTLIIWLCLSAEFLTLCSDSHQCLQAPKFRVILGQLFTICMKKQRKPFVKEGKRKCKYPEENRSRPWGGGGVLEGQRNRNIP